jgi:hypothetical protein
MNMPISENDRELIHQLLDDIRLIEDLFIGGVPKPVVVRTTLTPILRRWIAEALFYRAQKLIMPQQIWFSIYSDGHSVKLCKAGIYEHWMALLLFRGIGISMNLPTKKYIRADGKPAIPLGNTGSPKPTPQKASMFFKQNILFWKGQLYSRTDVIKMHANVLGGVHLDFRRTQDEKHIMEIKNYLGYEIDGNNIKILVGEDIDSARADHAKVRTHLAQKMTVAARVIAAMKMSAQRS